VSWCCALLGLVEVDVLVVEVVLGQRRLGSARRAAGGAVVAVAEARQRGLAGDRLVRDDLRALLLR
jgi:hypothetical protein